MTQQSNESPQTPARLNPFWLAGIVVVMLGLGVYGGRYFERHRSSSPQDKIQGAIDELTSGYDQTALSILKPLAAKGNPKAQYWLADIYENGLGVKADIPAAMALLEKSAAQNFLPAEVHLGGLYLRGNETLQDFGKAESWLQKAAIAGDAQAQRELGQMYALGLGVARDPSEAYGWFENATLHGDGLAKHMRDDLLTRMTQAEIDKGEQDAKDIVATIKPPTP